MAFHRRGDRQMTEVLKAEDLDRDAVPRPGGPRRALRLELVEPHKEAVRRGATLFALPIHAADGARALGNGRCDLDGAGRCTPTT
jgi:ubiquinone biosynthesis protein COQ9